MSNQPPGQPTYVDVSRNPNALDPRDRPPPPVLIQPGESILIPVEGSPAQQGVVMNGPNQGMPIHMGGGAMVNGVVMGGPPPPPYPGLPSFGSGMMHPGLMPSMGGFGMGMGMGGFGMTPQGFPPAPNPGTGVSPLAASQIGMGGLGMGMMPGMPPPFMPGGMPWSNYGMGFGGMMGGVGGWHKQPLPWIESQGGGVGPPGGNQNDPTVKPGGDLPGHTVVQPAETTSIFRILSNVLPWEHVGMSLTVEAMQFDSGWTINRVIAAMRKPNTDCQGWGMTQCIELGGGRWAKGMTYVHGSQQATERTLGMVGMGSGNNRNGTTEKLYVHVHRI